MKRQHQVLLAVLLVVAVGALAFWWWRGRSAAPELAALPAAASAVPAASAVVTAAASAPAILHPIEAIEPVEGAPDLAATLAALFGRQAVDTLFVLDDFPHRFVATVDNLGRATATPRLWPLRSTPGRFAVAETKDGATVTGADNGLRYVPLLSALESVDMARAAQAYKRLYPQLQQAYQDLGYPDAYFNDRLVEVIDSMLATPDAAAPLEVRLPNTEGASAPARPWLLYEFADPALAALPAGQKLLLRSGPANERRIKARLIELRRLIAPA
jgi:Protein of unknown function (DUF3014)